MTTTVLELGGSSVLPELVDDLKKAFQVIAGPKGEAERDQLLRERGRDIRAVVTTSQHGIDNDFIAALPSLEIIANFGVGYDKIDVDFAAQRGIIVTNTPDVLNDCVADLAVGLMIDLLRAITASDAFVRDNGWRSGPYPLGRSVTGRRVGILGMGRIGAEIAQRLKGFRCEIAYHNRREVPGSEYRYLGSATELAQWADVLMVMTPGGPATDALVNAEVLAALGSSGYLINVARGSVVDEEALIDALKNDKIAGAGLDVFWDEPEVPQELRQLSNVVLTPHTGSATVETRRAMADVVLENLASWSNGKGPTTPVAEP